MELCNTDAEAWNRADDIPQIYLPSVEIPPIEEMAVVARHISGFGMLRIIFWYRRVRSAILLGGWGRRNRQPGRIGRSGGEVRYFRIRVTPPSDSRIDFPREADFPGWNW